MKRIISLKSSDERRQRKRARKLSMLRDLYPSVEQRELERICDFFDLYCTIVLRIVKRRAELDQQRR